MGISEGTRGQAPSGDPPDKVRPLYRRQALRALATGAGAAAATTWVESLSALAAAAGACARAPQAAIAAQDWTPRVLNAQQNEAIVTLTELIIPQTETPGAKAARVNRFIDAVLSDAKPADRDTFLRGLAWMDERSRTLFGKDFVAAGASGTDSAPHAALERRKPGRRRPDRRRVLPGHQVDDDQTATTRRRSASGRSSATTGSCSWRSSRAAPIPNIRLEMRGCQGAKELVG